MSAPLRVAVVGCGVIAPIHVGSAHPGARLAYVGAFDSDEQRAAALAGRFALPRAYSEWSAVLADESVDAVDLCVPHHLHHPLALQALAAGKHVLVEKPLATTTAEAAEMVEAAREARRVLLPVHNRVFVPTLVRLRELVAGGALGEVYLIKTLGIEPPETVSVRPWLAQHRYGGGGVTMAQTIHFAYLCRFLMGDVQHVTSLHGRRLVAGMEDEDTAVILLQFASGSLGELTSTFAQQAGGHEHRVTVYGTQGTATATHSRLQVAAPALYGDALPHEALLLEDTMHADFTAVLADFARAALGEGPSAVSALDGLRAVEIIEAAALAARERRVVDLPLPAAR